MSVLSPQFHPVMHDPLAQISGVLGWIDAPAQQEDSTRDMHYIVAVHNEQMTVLARVNHGSFSLPQEDELKDIAKGSYSITALTYELSDVTIAAVAPNAASISHVIEATVPQQDTAIARASIPGYTSLTSRQPLAYTTYHTPDQGYEFEHTVFGVPDRLREVCSMQDITVATWAYWGRAQCSLAFLDAEITHLTTGKTIDELISNLGLTAQGKVIRTPTPALMPAQLALQELLVDQQRIELKIEAGVVLDPHEHQVTLHIDSLGRAVALPVTEDTEFRFDLYTLRLNQALLAAERLMLAPDCLASTPGIQALACETAFVRAASVSMLPCSLERLLPITQPHDQWSAHDVVLNAQLSSQHENNDEASQRIALERRLQSILLPVEPTSFTYSIDIAASTVLVETGAPPINLLPTSTASPDNLTEQVNSSRSHRARLYEMTVRMQALLYARWAAAACPTIQRVVSVCGKGSDLYLRLNAPINRLAGVQEVYASLLVTANTRKHLLTPLRAAYEQLMNWHAYPIDPAPCVSDWPAFVSSDYDRDDHSTNMPVRLRHEHLNFSYHRNAPEGFALTSGLYDDRRHLQLSALQQSILSSAQERFDALYSTQAGLHTDMSRQKIAENCSKIHKLLRVAFAPVFKAQQTSYLSFSSCATYHLYQQRVEIPQSVTFVPYSLVDLCIVLMDIYDALEMYQAARSLMPALLRLAPGDPDLYLQCATLCTSMQEFDMAAQYLDEAEPYIFCDDHVWAAYTRRSHIAVAKGTLEEAHAWQLLACSVLDSSMSRAMLRDIERMIGRCPYQHASEARMALERWGRRMLPLEGTLQTVSQLVLDLVNARLYGDADVVLTELNTVVRTEEMPLLTRSLLHSELGRELQMHEQRGV